MSNIRIMAAATAIIAAFAFAPASAGPCDDGSGSCNNVQRTAAKPLSLSQFVKPEDRTTAKPRHSKKKLHARTAKTKSDPVEGDAQSASTTQPAAVSAAAPPPSASETDGVAISSADDLNELDAAASNVVVVAANELNEIDLATPAAQETAAAEAAVPAAPAAPQYQTQAVEAAAPADHPSDQASWIGRIFVALGGVLAAVSAARLLIA